MKIPPQNCYYISECLREVLLSLRQSSVDITCASRASMPVSAVRVPRLCKKYTRSE